MVETLQELVERCRAGDAEAATILVGRFRCWLFDLSCALVHDRVLAEDVVQETLVAALQSLGGLRNPEALPGWLRQILRRQAGRMVRKNGDTASWNAEDVPEQASSARGRIAHNELRGIVREALGKLPPAEREAAVRFYMEQQRCMEIAKALSVPNGTVRRRLFDARTRLRGLLSDYVDDRPDEHRAGRTSDGLPF